MRNAGTNNPGLHVIHEPDPIRLDQLVRELVGASLYGDAAVATVDLQSAFYWGPEAGFYFLLDNIRDEISLRLQSGGAGGSLRTHEEVLEAVGLRELVPTAHLVSPHALSGGQQQRLLAGILLARMPRLVVAQTPLIYVDDLGRFELYKLLATAAHRDGTTVLLAGEDSRGLGGVSVDQVRWIDGRFESVSKNDQTRLNQSDRWEKSAQYRAIDKGEVGEIDLSCTTWRYPDGRIGITVDKFYLSRGAVCVVCGPNGGGKSSLVRMLCSDWRIRPPASLRCCDFTVQNPYRELIRPGYLAFALQDPNAHVQPLTVRECLRRAGVSDTLAASFRLDAFDDADLILAPFWVKQALSLVVALSSNAPYLLLDEPVDGYAMEVVGSAAVEALMAARFLGKGVLLVTHNPRLAWAVADHFVWVEHRKVTGTFARNELPRAPRRLAEWLTYPVLRDGT